MFQTPRSPPILSSFIDHTIRIKRWDFPISVKHVYLKTVIKLSDIKFFGIQVTWQIRTIVSLDIYKNKNRRIDIHSLLATNSILNSLFYIVVLRSILRYITYKFRKKHSWNDKVNGSPWNWFRWSIRSNDHDVTTTISAFQRGRVVFKRVIVGNINSRWSVGDAYQHPPESIIAS